MQFKTRLIVINYGNSAINLDFKNLPDSIDCLFFQLVNEANLPANLKPCLKMIYGVELFQTKLGKLSLYGAGFKVELLLQSHTTKNIGCCDIRLLSFSLFPDPVR